MTIKSLVSIIGERNITDKFTKEELTKIAADVIEREGQDTASMKDWAECINKGMELCKPEWKSKDKPWVGSANYKSTILAEAANMFGNRAGIELLRDPKLVKTSIIGADTIKNVIDRRANENTQLKAQIDELAPQVEQFPEFAQALEQIKAKYAENEKGIADKRQELRKRNERADRVGETLNWQVNYQKEDWRKDLKRLLYLLPNVGCFFKKNYYDEALGGCESDAILYPNFSVNVATKNLKTCRSFTHFIPFSKSEAESRMASGLWRDVPLYADKENGDKGSNEDEGVENAADNSERFLEQYCWLDVDKDGVDEPYIVTVHHASQQVVRIAPRFSYDTIYVSFEGGKIATLIDAQNKRNERLRELSANPEYPDPEDLTGYRVMRVEPIAILTKYSLIPALDGSFLDWGYFHLIGSNAMGVNKTTNELLNSGTLANMQGGVTSVNFRKKPGTFTLAPGEYVTTEVRPEHLHQSILPLPYKEPSPTLYQLNEKMESAARGFGASIDMDGRIQGNTAPTTALAMIQESLIQQTAHNALIADSMGDEFKILYAIDRDYLEQSDYVKITGDDEADVAVDFAEDGLEIGCSANPELSSRMQRMMLAEAEMAQIPYVIQAGGNPVPIIKNYYKRIGSDNVDQIFPNEAELSPEDKAQRDQMRQMQEQQLKYQQRQDAFLEAQTQILLKGEERKDKEFMLKVEQVTSDLTMAVEEMRKIRAETLLTQEKAETEAVNNGISIYTAASDQLTKAEESLGAPNAED